MNQHESANWKTFQKISFRFFFIYLTLYMAPWAWLDDVVTEGPLISPLQAATDWAVNAGNRYLFHVRDVLVPLNGSGDTSYGWAQLWLYLTLALSGSLLWSALDRRRTGHELLYYSLRTFVRYYIALSLLSYGIIKLFAMQMAFPQTSQLATPLGDLLPMRFSWLFIGYSTAYQVFLGIVETLGGLLLLNRKTVTLGLMIGAGVFTNVVMLNICYDVPVKIYSLHMLFCCLFLLAADIRRLYTFFILNTATTGNTLYHLFLPKKWMRRTRIALKVAFVVLAVLLPLFKTWSYWQSWKQTPLPRPFAGIYNVEVFAVNGDTIPATVSEAMRWRDIIFDSGNFGTIGTTDTLFAQRYRRARFAFKSDTLNQTIAIKKIATDSLPLFTLHYELADKDLVRIHTLIRGDSVYMEWVKSKRQFQLAERQFHWLSEANR